MDDEISTPADAEAEVLASGSASTAMTVLGVPNPPGSKRGRAFAIGGAAVLVLATGAGAIAVGSALSGGGSQPEALVPKSAVAYVELDLDPSAGQKMQAFTFLRKFPQLQDSLSADGSLGPVLSKMFKGSAVDYAQDIQPWLGDRYAAAVVPGTKRAPVLELVLQTTDEAAAQASLTRLLATSGAGSQASVATRDGYVVIAASVSPLGGADGANVAQQLVDDSAEANLSANQAYASDIEAFPSGIATMWVDNAGIGSLAKDLVPGLGGGLATSGLTQAEGTSVAVLRFDDGALTLDGRGEVTQPLGSAGVPAVLDLPDQTMVAAGGSDIGTALKESFASSLKQLAGAGLPQGMFGRSSLDDTLGKWNNPKTWPMLFGDQTVLAVSVTADGEPEVGVRVVGGPDTVDALSQLVGDSTGKRKVTTVPTSDGVVLATSPAWAQSIADGGRLGDSALFRSAVPKAASASLVAFVDFDALQASLASNGSASGTADLATLKPLKALGFSVSYEGSVGTFSLRITTD